MSTLLVAVLTWFLAAAPPFQADVLNPVPADAGRTPLPQTGVATFYADGLMAYVEGYRRERGQVADCPECVGAVALLRAGDIGRKVWLQPPGGEPVGPFLVVDCARSEDVAPLLARNWVVDVSYEVGQLWGMDRPLDGVTVFEDPSDVTWAGPLRASPTRFYVPPGQVVLSAPTATPAVTAGAPTPWPTRQPVALAAAQMPWPAPAATQTSAGPSPTPPLTPIISTPTPQVTTPPVASEGSPAEPSVATPAPTPSATPPVEVALGRPGSGLLMDSLPPTPTAAPSATPPAFTSIPVRAPRATSPPILAQRATATPEAAPEAGQPFWRLWRSLLSLVVH
ncbi:MAG: hypothetical protein AUK03_07000 [Anaerolineae bacterium CG2_30_64_16]|nr:MAG: hypothetical protein AUK03_07000 [Anaerolineae bacterium CG2_30_64_16]